eukprot:XP_015579171.1 putative zinc finger A20 and AN1 domain-containing stress-associated protein 8 [Ricinus communis]
MDSPNSSVTPPSCARGCGFFGSAENRNMCSKCYTDYLKQEIIAKTNSAPEPSPASNSLSNKIATCINIKEAAAEEEETAKSVPVAKNRCESCNKKVGVTGFACRCGKVLCGTHRYPKEHCCTFDFKRADRDLLVKQNPLVKGNKMDNRL